MVPIRTLPVQALLPRSTTLTGHWGLHQPCCAHGQFGMPSPTHDKRMGTARNMTKIMSECSA